MIIIVLLTLPLAIAWLLLPFYVIGMANTTRRLEHKLGRMVELADAADNRSRATAVQNSLLQAVASGVGL